ncbi:MAG: TIGR04255 family protein [Candidatus Binatia bacterium]
MIFDETPRESYRHNPLREVICQLRFPTILRVATEVPTRFQEHIRERYPLYANERPTETLPKEINEILAGVASPISIKQQSVHKFETESRARLISLSQDFLAFSEKSYIRWSHFRGEIKAIEDAFRSEYSPAFYARIGLRYQNIIDKESLGLGDCPWAKLFDGSLLGILDAYEEGILDVRTHSLLRLPHSPNCYVRIRHGLTQLNKKQAYIIDSDFFTEERRDPENAFTILDEFNRLSARFFRWAISPVLREAMGPVAID